MATAYGNLGAFSVESFSMDYVVPQETLNEFERLDKLAEARQLSPGFVWVPLIQEGQQSVKVHLVMEGPKPTKMTIMEGTKIIDRGTGLKFVHQNSRYFDGKFEIDIVPSSWASKGYHGTKLLVESMVCYI